MLEEFYQMIKTKTKPNVIRYCLDNDPAIISNHMRKWAKIQGVYFEFTALYLPNKDVVAERGIRANIKKQQSLIAN